MARFGGIPIEQETPKPTGPRFGGIPLVEKKEEPKQEPEKPFEFSTLETAKNIPSSAANLAKNIFTAITSPVQTAKAVEKTVSGGLFKASEKLDDITPDWLDFMHEPIANLIFDTSAETFGKKDEKYAEAFVGALKERYGTAENMKKTIQTDPVGAATDLAAALTGAGGIVKGTAGLTGSATLGKTGELLSKAGTAIEPISAAARTTKAAASAAIPKGLPASMYEDVAKFSTTLPAAQREQMVRTALLNKIMPTTKGVQKLEQLAANLNSKVDSLISTAQESGKSVPRQAIYKKLGELRKEKGGVRLDAPEDLVAIDQIVKNFESHLKKLKKDNLTPKDLQKLKVEAYKSINWDAKRMTGAPIKEDTYKAVAKGAKELIEEVAPGTKITNKELGKLLELQPALQRAANRIENRNLIPIDAPMQIGAGSVAGGPAGTALGVIASLMGLPKMKAANALRLQRLIETPGLDMILKGSPEVSRANLAATLSGRAKEENQ